MNDLIKSHDKCPIEKPIVLCVDDEEAILASLNRLLRRHGYQPLSANCPLIALEILAQHSVDVLISDMRMQKMTGAVLLNRVSEEWPNIIRILLTGYSEPDSIESIGSDCYRVDKPWDDEELLGVIEKNLIMKNSEKEM